MKRTILALLLISLIHAASAQHTPTYLDTIALESDSFDHYFLNNDNIPLVKGRIINVPDSLKGKIQARYAVVIPTLEGQFSKNCAVDETGSFTFYLDYAFPYQEIWFTVEGLFYTRLVVKKDLFITLDYEVLSKDEVWMYGDGINYAGSDAALCEWASSSVMRFRYDEFKTDPTKEYFRTAYPIYKKKNQQEKLVARFKADMDSILNRRLDYVNQYVNNHPDVEGCKWLLQEEIENDIYKETLSELLKKKYYDTTLVDKLTCRRTYSITHASMDLTQKLLKTRCATTSMTSTDLTDFVQLLIVNLPDSSKTEREKLVHYKRIIAGKSILSVPKKIKTVRKLVEEYENELSAWLYTKDLDLIDTKIEKSKRDIYKLILLREDASIVDLLQTYHPFTFTNRWADTFFNNVNGNYKQRDVEISEQIKNLKIETSPLLSSVPYEKLSCGALLYKDEKSSGKEILNAVLKTHKGKFILIDFWGTWCAPCIGDLPYSRDLHAKMKNDRIEFVYLCCQSPEKAWKERINSISLPGTHFLLSEKQRSELMNQFNLTGFPSYVLIDAKGNYKRTPTMFMNEMTPETLRKLLKD